MKLDSVRAGHVEVDLALLFGEEQASALRVRLDGLLTEHALQRDADKPPLEALSERDAVLITYGNTLSAAGEAPLDTLGRFLGEHVGDAVSIVHLLPIFPYSSDDGFSVVDYRTVNPELGDWSNVRALAEHYGLALDLVLNHCSRSHHWFHDFLAGRPNAKDWFIEADPHEPALGLVTRPRSTPLLTPVDVSGRGRRWIWTTFSPDQVDLNFRNPEVLLAFAEILLLYMRQGARLLRLDAVAYVWKTLGTPCTSLPEVHAVVRILRALVDTAEPGTLLLTETNVPSAENLSYLGQGDEAHLVYQFSLPPLLLHALWRGETGVLQTWLAELPEPPSGTAYLNFTASHDGVGLRPLEGLIDEAERDAMLADMRTRGGFVSPRRMPDGRESPYELNISYLSALAGDDGEDMQLARFLLTQTLALSLRGLPALYIHSLLGTPNDMHGVEQTGQLRAINRRRWDWGELNHLLGQPETVHSRCLRELTRRLRLRAGQAAFDPQAAQSVLDLGVELLGVLRTAADGRRVLCLFNFTGERRRIALDALPSDLNDAEDLLGSRAALRLGAELELEPYAAVWLPAGVGV
ncbi:MAG: sugar phosphorylase [Acidihalobacter sp.]|uniref:sugar phosphorylase n=1 Tax=Acidihalobacter sp. TaxID=1872108 RepID=UPI00307D4444